MSNRKAALKRRSGHEPRGKPEKADHDGDEENIGQSGTRILHGNDG
jgi:hypothetical protein